MSDRVLHALIQGPSGSGKTSMLAGAANMGIRVIHLCLGSESAEPLRYFTKPECRKNLELLHFRDTYELAADDDPEQRGLRIGSRMISQVEKFLFSGKLGSRKDVTQPYGHPQEWGPATLVAVDGLTPLGDSAEARALELNPTTREGHHLWVAGQAQKGVAQLGRTLNCHFLFLCHIDIKGPKPETGYKDETELQKQIKRERAQIEETGYFPQACSVKISRNFPHQFPFSLLTETDVEQVTRANPSGRVVRTGPVPGYLIKCPVNVKDRLPIMDAIPTILNAMEE